MAITLYDLAGAEVDRRFSPYCWRTRLALAHKELPVETVPWRFTEKEAIAFSGQVRVPVIVDGDKAVADSWAIAMYLEDAYPQRPSLFGGDIGRAVARFLNNWADTVMVPGLARLVVSDVLAHLHEKDQDYFRKTREERFGMPLEAVTAKRETQVLVFRESLNPLRMTLRTQPFLGGTEPAYADYIVFGPLQWVRCTSRFSILEPGDPIAVWRERLLDRFDGLARKAPGYDA